MEWGCTRTYAYRYYNIMWKEILAYFSLEDDGQTTIIFLYLLQKFPVTLQTVDMTALGLISSSE